MLHFEVDAWARDWAAAWTKVASGSVASFEAFGRKRNLSCNSLLSTTHQQLSEIMSWRNQGITGSNNIPLGNRRRFGGDNADEGGYNPAAPAEGLSELKRGRSPQRGKSSTHPKSRSHTYSPYTDPDGPRQRRKKNRWGDASENKAAGLMGLPTAIYSAMTTEQLDAYTLHLRIEEITQKLKINDVVPADGDRYVPAHCNHLSASDMILGLPHLLRSTTTSVAVSILASSATASVSKTSATSSWRRR